MHSQQGILRPALGSCDRRPGELAGERPVVVAPDCDQFRALGQLIEKGFDPEPLLRAWPWSMHDVTEEDQAPRRELGNNPEDASASSLVDERPQFSFTPLGPTVAKMKVGQKQSPGCR